MKVLTARVGRQKKLLNAMICTIHDKYVPVTIETEREWNP